MRPPSQRRSLHDGTTAGPRDGLNSQCAYDRHYFATALGPPPYDRQQPQWLEFFGAIADHIVAEIKPRRVLDVGCAKGFLVEALRDRGVEAFGIDVSAYAIEEVRPDIQPYCRVTSAVEAFEGRYDLVTCLEVLEHLTEEEGRLAIANICRSTGDVLFSSTPDDSTEPTHVNVRPRSWWITQFAEYGLQLVVEFDAGFVAAHAMRLKMSTVSESPLDRLLDQRHHLLQQVATLRRDLDDRDRTIADLNAALTHVRAGPGRCQRDIAAVPLGGQAQRDELSAARLAAADLRAALDASEATIADLHREQEGLRRSAHDRDATIAGLNYHLLAVQRTLGWKVLGRFRRGRDWLLPRASRRRALYWQVRRPMEVLLDEGLMALVRKTRYRIRLRWQGHQVLVKGPPGELTPNSELQYCLWVERYRLTPDAAARLRAMVGALSYRPLVSIVTPVYNTDEVWLRKAVDSVRTQIYPHWELCLVNDGGTKPGVQTVLDEYAALDSRVRVKHLPTNQGIAGASNHGLAVATGEFVALLDHDDELPPEALFEVVRRLNHDRDLDLIYTDEDKLDASGCRVEPFFKPDWNPDLLLSMNYITHLSVFRRSLLDKIGGFSLGLDGSQDYDLLLRFTERTQRIGHIPKILYHWRKGPGSAAASPDAKPFAYEAGRRALEEAMRRRGHPARVNSLSPGQYAVHYKIAGQPLVSIIIPTRDRWPLLRECLRSIEERTAYPGYEIIVLDNDSVEPETREGLRVISEKWRVYPCPGPFNFSAINNVGAARARGEYLVFLNNDTQVVEPDWLTAMLEHAQRPEVGAVGARLHYPDGRIQHAGVVLGVGGAADHAFKGLHGNAATYFSFADVVRDCSAVTAACMMTSRRVFEEVNGFDERFQVALNDIDLCLRLRQRGYLIVYTPFALLYHHESGTRGGVNPPSDEALGWARWGDLIRRGDPYYNPNLTLSGCDWSLGDLS